MTYIYDVTIICKVQADDTTDAMSIARDMVHDCNEKSIMVMQTDEEPEL